VRLAQYGDVLAKHDLHRLFTPLLRKVIAPFRSEKELYQELHGEVCLIFDRLVLKFDESRGIDLPAYMAHVLPKAVAVFVRRWREKAGREVALSSMVTAADPDAWMETVEQVLQQLGAEELLWIHRAGNLAERVVERVTLEQAIQSLPPRQREVFTLREVEGYSYTEIAVRMDIKASTVRTHLEKALANLRKFLQGISEED